MISTSVLLFVNFYRIIGLSVNLNSKSSVKLAVELELIRVSSLRTCCH